MVISAPAGVFLPAPSTPAAGRPKSAPGFGLLRVAAACRHGWTATDNVSGCDGPQPATHRDDLLLHTGSSVRASEARARPGEVRRVRTVCGRPPAHEELARGQRILEQRVAGRSQIILASVLRALQRDRMLAAQLAHVARGQVAPARPTAASLLAVFHYAQHAAADRRHPRGRHRAPWCGRRPPAPCSRVPSQFAQVSAVPAARRLAALHGWPDPARRRPRAVQRTASIRILSVAAGRDHLRLRQFQLDPHAVVGGQREARGSAFSHMLVHLARAQRRVSGAVAEVRPRDARPPSARRPYRTDPSERRRAPRTAQADGHVGLVAGDRGFRVGEQLTVHQVARQVAVALAEVAPNASAATGSRSATQPPDPRPRRTPTARCRSPPASTAGTRPPSPAPRCALRPVRVACAPAAGAGTGPDRPATPARSPRRRPRRGGGAGNAPHVGAARRYRRHGAPLG